jgi:hypothetical protein
MSIDMKNFAGEIEAPAAVEQQIVDTIPVNQEVQEEFPMPEIPVAPTPEVKAPVEERQEHPQAANFRALESKIDQIKAERDAERREFQLQMEMMRANVAQKPEQAKPKKMFEGMEDSEIPNAGEIRKAWNERESEYTSRIEELTVMSQHSDYAEVLEKHAAPLLKEKPHLLKGIMSSDNKAMALYELGKLAQKVQQPMPQMTEAPKSTNAQRIVENARKPGTLAQAGGRSGVLSQADHLANMSDQEFLKFASKHLEGI